jgi:hypothetical protein
MGFGFTQRSGSSSNAQIYPQSPIRNKIPDKNPYQGQETTSSCGRDTPNTPYIGESLAYKLFIP